MKRASSPRWKIRSATRSSSTVRALRTESRPDAQAWPIRLVSDATRDFTASIWDSADSAPCSPNSHRICPASKPTPFVFDCFSNPSAEVINERFDAFVDTIRRTHPTTPLIFLQTIRRETRNFSTRIEKFEREKQAAAEAQVRDRMKTDKNIYFVDPGRSAGQRPYRHGRRNASDRSRIYLHARPYRAADPQDTRQIRHTLTAPPQGESSAAGVRTPAALPFYNEKSALPLRIGHV